jgi:hypothetical protein
MGRLGSIIFAQHYHVYAVVGGEDNRIAGIIAFLIEILDWIVRVLPI